MRGLIVDDEESARARLGRLLVKHSEVSLIGEAHDGLEALDKIGNLRPDLLFLDIQMPGLTGFEVLRSIPETVPLPLVIFVTGYDRYALDAFEANALAYLLKPVEPERLSSAIARAIRLGTAALEQEKESRTIVRIARTCSTVLRHIVCRRRDKIVLLAPEQILWFEAEGGIVKARTAEEWYWVNYQLIELETGLPATLFFRARREILLNLKGIKEIRPYFKSGFLIVMSDMGTTEIAVSERQVKTLRKRVPGL